MDRCANQPGWKAYFDENMNDLGMPPPDSIYSKAVIALGTWKGITAAVERFGPRVTIYELAKAGLRTDFEVMAGGMIASAYVGGVIGSAAVATGRHMACGTRMIDAIGYARTNYPDAPWLVRHFQRHPEIYMAGASNRRAYGAAARMRT